MAKKEVQLPITERVKSALGIIEDYDIFTLFRLLTKARNNSHPDKFTEELQGEANEKCTFLNTLIAEFNLFIQQSKLDQNPLEIIPYEELYNEVKLNNENAELYNKNLELQNENKLLKNDVNEKQISIDVLKKALEDIQSKNLIELQSELVELYKPKKINFIIPGVMAILLIAINLISTLNLLKSKVVSILPFSPEYLNIGLFSILIFSILNIFIKNYQYSRLQQISHEIVSSQTIKLFYDNYTRESDVSYWKRIVFTETDVSDFIKTTYFPTKNLGRWMLSNRFKNINYLKDIFIDNLIMKKLIEIGGSKNLDREFYVKG